MCAIILALKMGGALELKFLSWVFGVVRQVTVDVPGRRFLQGKGP